MTPTAARSFRRVVWLAPLAFALHEAEEWNILAWYQAHWRNVGDLSPLVVRTWLVFPFYRLSSAIADLLFGK